jgi:hypothetical protein
MIPSFYIIPVSCRGRRIGSRAGGLLKGSMGFVKQVSTTVTMFRIVVHRGCLLETLLMQSILGR